MCGGSIEIVPCSRVGHIFRTFSPYKWTTAVKLPEYNYKRVAEVHLHNCTNAQMYKCTCRCGWITIRSSTTTGWARLELGGK